MECGGLTPLSMRQRVTNAIPRSESAVKPAQSKGAPPDRPADLRCGGRCLGATCLLIQLTDCVPECRAGNARLFKLRSHLPPSEHDTNPDNHRGCLARRGFYDLHA